MNGVRPNDSDNFLNNEDCTECAEGLEREEDYD